jgi:DNA-binding MarR family transcriptional regulator
MTTPANRRGHDRLPRLGAALGRAWVGYQLRLDEAMAEAGFADRRPPDGRVLRLCRTTPEISISQIGRELSITRQGAAKLVNGLRDRGYVTLNPSPRDSREKLVTLTSRALDYLSAQQAAATRVEAQLRQRLGNDGFDSLHRLLDVIGGVDQPRIREYLASRR